MVGKLRYCLALATVGTVLAGSDVAALDCDVLAVAVYRDLEFGPGAEFVDDAIGGGLREFLTTSGAKGEKGEAVLERFLAELFDLRLRRFGLEERVVDRLRDVLVDRGAAERVADAPRACPEEEPHGSGVLAGAVAAADGAATRARAAAGGRR